MVVRREHLMVLEVREWSASGELYAIVDACDMPCVIEKVNDLGNERAVSLYRGMAEESHEAIAPYLMTVDPPLFDWITETLWSEPWGVFMRSASELGVLRTHFRKFLIVKSPKDDDWYFRYYDPRVLDTYLSTCTGEELARFFGPVELFGLTDTETYGVTTLTRQ